MLPGGPGSGMRRRGTWEHWSSVAIPAALALSLAATAAHAGTTGKLSGVVRDAKKQPLAGANVALPDARLGAITEADGSYVIYNVPAGTHSLRVGLIGYATTTLTDVAIPADRTTTLDVTLQETAVQLQEVVVQAQRPVVELGLTSNVSTVTRKEITTLPVQQLEDIVNLQAGVVDGHIRGGRKDEVQYQVDGLSVNNPYDNARSIRLDRSVLEEVQVISGTFDAEYGQAMSGVVNSVLRRGSDRFQWSGEAYNGDFVYSDRPSPDAFHPGTFQNYQFTVSGPTGLPQTLFLASGRYGVNDGYVRGYQKLFNLERPAPDSVVVNPVGLDSLPVGMSHEWLALAKLSTRSIPGVELSYQAILNGIESRDQNWDYRYTVSALPTRHTFSAVHGFEWTHALSPQTFYRLNLRQNYFDYHEWVYEDFYDSRYDLYGAALSGYGLGFAPPGFLYDAILAGVSNTRFVQNTNAIVMAGSISKQLSRDHQIKGGFDWEPTRVKFGTPGYLVWSGRDWSRHINEPEFPAPQTYDPRIGSAYAQDDIEWNDLRFRGGLRFDFFDARTLVPGDFANPANVIQGAATVPPHKTSRKLSLAPRIGISYPITVKSSLFFSYGHFYQMPQLGQMFKNADYSILSTLQDSSEHDYGVLGNPDVKPEKTVQYQFGYKQQLRDWLGLDLTRFYKDILDLLGTEIQTTYNNADYERLSNLDFGTVTGKTVALVQRPVGPVSTALDYTWQIGLGSSSDPYEAAARRDAKEDLRPQQVPLNWDQRHTLNLTLTVSDPGSYAVSGVFRAVSGQPYSPDASDFGTLERNSGRKPPAFLMDLRAEWTPIRLAGAALSVFGVAYNLFDTRFFNGDVFASTGSPYYPRVVTYSEEKQLANPTRYYSPRRIQLGLRWEGGAR